MEPSLARGPRQSRARAKPPGVNQANNTNSQASQKTNQSRPQNTQTNKQKPPPKVDPKLIEQQEKEEEERRKRESEKKFHTHQEQSKQTIKKLLQDEEEEEEESDSDEEDKNEKLREKLTKNYSGEKEEDLRKIKELIEIKQSTCVVCLEKVRNKDGIWQCNQCYCLLHLSCTQKWARSVYSEENGGNETKTGNWPCPKCRMLYPRENIPRNYYCFCGKKQNPEIDLWILPHTCGDRCEKLLKPNCGHTCTLLCHPGPCPPCPQLVQSKCYCEKTKTTRRCNDQRFVCEKVCGKKLDCGIHTCEEKCHPGECPRCPRMKNQKCECGSESKMIPCGEKEYHCAKVCNRLKRCGKHQCDTVCHSAEACSEMCLFDGVRICHCGKKKFDNLFCTDATPSCGDTCNKQLPCGHRCLQRCHPGECAICRIHTVKPCRCGLSKRSVQCHQEYLCEKKCNEIRNCKRHTCKKKCCPGDCPPCNEICNNKLPCGNHKCEAICHSSACFPCTVTIDVTCFCKETKITVPCGVEKRTKPPKCKKDCKIPTTCHHESRVSHQCHFGECPTCEKVCEAPLSGCYHKCPHKCHDPPPRLDHLTPKQLKNYNPMKRNQRLPMSQVKCAPCDSIVNRQCLGFHQNYPVSCHSARLFDCKRKCGNPLACGNHSCQLNCHPVTKIRDSRSFVEDLNDSLNLETFNKPAELSIQMSERQSKLFTNLKDLKSLLKLYHEQYPDSCPSCELPCQKSRNPPCKHPCKLPCHPGACPPCKTVIRKYCHCPLKTLKIMHCHETHIPAEELDKQLCCGNECAKKISCGHVCNNICHSGPCRDSSDCTAKVQKYCNCKHKKVSVPCNKQNETTVDCDQSCADWKAAQLEKQRLKELEIQQKKLEEQQNNERTLKEPKAKKVKRPQILTKNAQKSSIQVTYEKFCKRVTNKDNWKIIFIYSMPFLLVLLIVALSLITK